MLTLYRYFKTLSNYNQVLGVQAIIYIVAALGLVIFWDWKLFLIGVVLGWWLFCVGISISLHKMVSHKTFVPKNQLIKFILLWAGVQSTLGSPIAFAAGHRQHHINSDTDLDPFKLSSFWHNVKLWFYHFSIIDISPRIIKDIAADSDIKLFHNHYWKIWAIYPSILLCIGPIYFVYLFAIPVVYGFLGMSYVTVIAHSTTWNKLFNNLKKSNNLDDSWDSDFFSVLFAGEGYHHTHHKSPGMYNYSKMNNKFDFSGWLISILKR